MSSLLIRDCEIDGIGVLDVRISDGVVVEIAPSLGSHAEDVLPARGGALIPGLHDHHLHLFALAAALDSVDCGPSATRNVDELATALRTAAARGAVRGVGYFESVAGTLDRGVLDALVPDVPVRVQHRSGAVWFLNSIALTDTGLADSSDLAVQRDEHGRPTGRIVRGDHLLRSADSVRPELTQVGRLLSSYGVTGVTDATPRLDVESVMALHAAQDDRALPQRMLLLGAPLAAAQAIGVPWKIVVDESQGLDPAALADEIHAAHKARRAVALHCTSRAETVLAVTVLLASGPHPGDRLEHAGVLPPEFDADLAGAGVTVVTQPHFVTERGDDYLRDVEPEDHELLYRCGSLLDLGVPVALGTDAPFGCPDPWAVIAAAGTRRTKNGVTISAHERIDARRALHAFLGSGMNPGGPPRQVQVGAAADLCLLDDPLDAVLSEPVRSHVVATINGGAVVYRRQR